jgi:hypothetical protein
VEKKNGGPLFWGPPGVGSGENDPLGIGENLRSKNERHDFTDGSLNLRLARLYGTLVQVRSRQFARFYSPYGKPVEPLRNKTRWGGASLSCDRWQRHHGGASSLMRRDSKSAVQRQHD